MPSRKMPAPTGLRPPPAPVSAMRFIFEYDGDAVRLLSQQPVDMAITGAELGQSLAVGYFVDARDADNRTLARVHARGLSGGTAEVFPETPGEPIVHVKVEQPKGAFTVVLPVPAGAARVALVQVLPQADAHTAAAGAAAPLRGTDIASFPLHRQP